MQLNPTENPESLPNFDKQDGQLPKNPAVSPRDSHGGPLPSNAETIKLASSFPQQLETQLVQDPPIKPLPRVPILDQYRAHQSQCKGSLQKCLQISCDVLNVPTTIFETVGGLKGTPKNPRPLKTPNDYSKLLYRQEVSKDLLRCVILKSVCAAQEQKIKSQADQGMLEVMEKNGKNLDDIDDQYNQIEQESMENEMRKLEIQLNHEAIVFTLKCKVLDRFCKQRLSSGQVLSTYRIEIDGFDNKFMGLKEDSSVQVPIFDLLIKSSNLHKVLRNRKEDDPSTFDEFVIIDGLKMCIINRHTILMKHGAMGAFQRQFDTVHNEAKLAADMAELNEGEELIQYDDDAMQLEKQLEDQDFIQDEIEDTGEGGVNIDMVNQSMSEHNVPTLTDQKHVEFICRKLFKENASSLIPIKRVLQMKIPITLSAAAEQKKKDNVMMKLYTVKDLFYHMRPDYVNIVGIFKNVQHININLREQKRKIDQMGGTDENVSLNNLQNKYIGEIHSTCDENMIPVILIEEGFSPLTSLLLSTSNHYIIVIQEARRMISSNMEVYVQVKISTSNIKIIGKFISMLQQNPFLDLDKEAMAENRRMTMLNQISPEIITRNTLNIRVRVIDINFIKFEFVCLLCSGGTLLSTAKCINRCANPRPVMKIFIRVTVQDEHNGEAFLSLRDESACTMFGINYHSSDLFKEYFFQHGIFYYKSLQKKFTPEYAAIIEFFKMTSTDMYNHFKVIPFCKVGYDDQSANDQTRVNLVDFMKRKGATKVGENDVELDEYGQGQNPLLKDFSTESSDHMRLLNKLIFVNGEVGEVTEESGRLNLHQFVCLRVVKYIKNKELDPSMQDKVVQVQDQIQEQKGQDLDSEMVDENGQAVRPSTWAVNESRGTTWARPATTQDIGTIAQQKKIA